MSDPRFTPVGLRSNGQPQSFASLLPGQEWTVETYAEHAWIAQDRRGFCYGGVINATAGTSFYEIK